MQLYISNLTTEQFEDMSEDELDMLLISPDTPPPTNEIFTTAKAGVSNQYGATIPGGFLLRGSRPADGLNRLWNRMNHPTYYDGDEA